MILRGLATLVLLGLFGSAAISQPVSLFSEGAPEKIPDCRVVFNQKNAHDRPRSLAADQVWSQRADLD